MRRWLGMASFAAAVCLAVPAFAVSVPIVIADGSVAPGLNISLDLTTALVGPPGPGQTNQATFVFANNSTGGAAGSRVHEVFFESGLADFLGAQLSPTNGPLLNPPSNPADPPGILPAWSSTLVGFDEQNANPSSPKGISVGQSWSVIFALDSLATTATDLVAAISNWAGNDRIALHIGECSTGNSCTAAAVAVPVPPAIALFGTGLAGIAFLARRRRKAPKLELA